MNRNCQAFFCWKWLGTVLLTGLVYACANRGYPEGGPKDTTPPEVVNENPVSFSTDFSKKRIEIYFDEFVQLKDIDKKFIISPPQNKKPKVRLKGKYIQVEIQDTLRPNTTYSLDFGDAIADNNEGNPLGYYRYVFSTGPVIDSLELAGNVVNAESGEPMRGVYVELYSNAADSMPLLELPDYVALTDSSGFFRVTNLRDTTYRIVAVEDNNRDYRYTPESEMFAFLDSVVRPRFMLMEKTDTIKIIESIVGRDTTTSDSLVTTQYMGFGPSNLYLRIFQEKSTQLYMVNDERKAREKLEFIFSIPGENEFGVRLWDTLPLPYLPEDWYIKEHSAGNDTITLWIKDSLVYKRDTFNVILSYLRTDSVGQRVMYADTVRYTFKEKKKAEGKARKKQDEEEGGKRPIEFVEIKTNAGNDFDLGARLWLEFARPLRDEEWQQLLRVEQKADTLYQPIAFSVGKDSLRIRRRYIDVPWKAGEEYRITLDSATVFDWYGHFNNTWTKKFKVHPEEHYGKVVLNVQGVQGNVILQLYKAETGKSDNGKRKYNVLREKEIRQDGEVVFDLLPAGKYRFRAILDTNGNGVWDTGLFLKGRQPEEVIYLPAEISVKQNFDIEQTFDLQATYKGMSDK